MLGVGTNDADYPAPFDHLAFVAHGLYAGSHFHIFILP
jgi:hypothetical protein